MWMNCFSSFKRIIKNNNLFQLINMTRILLSVFSFYSINGLFFKHSVRLTWMVTLFDVFNLCIVLCIFYFHSNVHSSWREWLTNKKNTAKIQKSAGQSFLYKLVIYKSEKIQMIVIIAIVNESKWVQEKSLSKVCYALCYKLFVNFK